MQLGERYAKITDGFNSIRDDAKSMVEQVEDGRIDTFERLANVWQKATRGDIAGRFEKVKKTYLDVVKDSKDQIEREQLILQAYLDFRGALKESEVLALQVLKTAEGELQAAQAKLKSRRRGRREGVGRRSRRARQARAGARRGAALRCSTPRTAIRSARTSRTI